MALSTNTNGSVNGQINTQNPQTSAPSSAGSPLAAPGSNVQPGTANSLLSGAVGGSDGIPLTSTILPVANLNTAAQGTVQNAKSTTTAKHHPNAVFLGLIIVVFIIGIIAFWLIGRSAKNTTEY
jgi:hypothetical protein